MHVIGSSRVGTEKGHLAAEIEGKDLLQKHIYTTAIEPALHTPQLHRRLKPQKVFRDDSKMSSRKCGYISPVMFHAENTLIHYRTVLLRFPL